MTSERKVTGGQTLGNLWQGSESHVGEPTPTSDGPAHGDAGDGVRDFVRSGCGANRFIP